MRKGICIIWFLLSTSLCCWAQEGFEHFITRQGDKLMEGQSELRLNFNFAGSTDGNLSTLIPAAKQDFYGGKGEYDYWKPVSYLLKPDTADIKFLKVKFTTDSQISRIEIGYGGPKSMNEKEIANELAIRVRKELTEDIISFWLKYGVDKQHGGFIGRMSNDLTIQKEAPKGLVLNARILWTFSALYRFDKKDDYLQTAKRAYDYLMQYFWDTQYGGAFWLLDYQGKPTDNSKELYGECFLIYALSEYSQASGDMQATEKAKELFNLIEKYCHDDANGGYYETFNRDWSRAEAAPGNR